MDAQQRNPHTLTPSGTGNEHENCPKRRLRKRYQLPSLSESDFDSLETVRRLSRTLTETFSLFTPGSSNVALTRLFSLSARTFTLYFCMRTGWGGTKMLKPR